MDYFPLINYVERAAPTSDSLLVSSRTYAHLPPFHADVRDLALTVQYIDPHATTYPFLPTISPRDRASSDPIVHCHCRRSSIVAVVTVAATTIAALPSRWPLLPPLPPSANVAPLQPSSLSFSPFPRRRCHPPRVSQSHRTCSVASFAVYTDKADELIPKSKTAERDMGFERPQAATPSRF